MTILTFLPKIMVLFEEDVQDDTYNYVLEILRYLPKERK